MKFYCITVMENCSVTELEVFADDTMMRIRLAMLIEEYKLDQVDPNTYRNNDQNIEVKRWESVTVSSLL